MDQQQLTTLATEFLAAWTSQDIDRTLACYTDDLVYTDPNTRGPVHGRDNMRRYLTRLFASWQMTWALRELYPLTEPDGAMVLWHATFRRAEGGPTVEADGMDLVHLRGDRIARNDVVFDRVALLGNGGSGREELKQLLLRGWMTHDAMWFAAALEEHGIAAANRLNRDAIRRMGPIEVKRVLAALGMRRVESFAEIREFMTGAMALLAGDYMDFRWDWQPPDHLRVDVVDCFAHKGISRLGAISEYECGIFDRIYAWFDALGVSYRASPDVIHCTQHHDHQCFRELRFFVPGREPRS